MTEKEVKKKSIKQRITFTAIVEADTEVNYPADWITIKATMPASVGKITYFKSVRGSIEDI